MLSYTLINCFSQVNVFANLDAKLNIDSRDDSDHLLIISQISENKQPVKNQININKLYIHAKIIT